MLFLTRKTLLDDLISMIPPQRVVAELLETVVPDEEVIAAATALRKAGYTLALDRANSKLKVFSIGVTEATTTTATQVLTARVTFDGYTP